MTITFDLPAADATEYSARNTEPDGYGQLPLSLIVPSPLNPRKLFDDAALEELADSLRQHGMLEPIVVRIRPRTEGSAAVYEIVAGERRYRAARLAGLTTVPVRVLRDIDDAAALRLALVENLQRQDLDPIEEAQAFRQLVDVCGLKQAEIGKAVGRSQSAIAKRLALLKLPESVLAMVHEGKLTPSHAVALTRWNASEKVVEAIADMAIAHQWDSKTLENLASIPYSPELYRLTRQLGYGASYQFAECDNCPFGARVGRICLRPTHYDELEAAANAAKEARRQEVIAGLATSNEATKEEVASTLPTYQELCQVLGYDAVQQIGRSSPTECQAGTCPCARRALGHNGEPVPVCVDPKRRSRLQAAASRQEGKEARAVLATKREQVIAVIDGLADHNDDGAIALVAYYALRQYFGGGARAAAVERWLPGRGDSIDQYGRVDVSALDSLPLAELLRAAVGAIVFQDLHQAEQSRRTSAPLVDWLLGVREAEGGDA